MTEISKVEFLLRVEESVLLNNLGVWKFQMDTYGSFDPDKLLKDDYEEKGIETFNSYLEQVKDNVCEYWNDIKDNGLVEDTKDIYFLIIGILFASNVPYFAALYIGAILLKRGLNKICD